MPRCMLALVALAFCLSACSIWQRPEGGLARPDPGEPMAPDVDGPVETVAEGRIEGQRWRLSAYRNNGSTCVDLYTASGGGGGCGFEGMRGALSMNSIGWTGDVPDYAQLKGRVSDRVARLTGRSGDGPVHELPLYRSKRFGLTLFVVFAPVDAGYELTAYDDEGEVLATRVLSRSELDLEHGRL